MRRFDFSNKILLIFALILIAVFIILSLVTFIFFETNQLSQRTQGKLEGLTPGKATLEEVKKSLGTPESTKDQKDGKSYYYSTESLDYKNIVGFKDNKVKFTLENIFDLRPLNDYKKEYGSPDLLLYDPHDEVLTWNIFLDDGVGLASVYDSGVP